MSSVQPENGLPERRVITADSFRALKLKLSGGNRQAAVLPLPDIALAGTIPPGPAPPVETISESIEALPVEAAPVLEPPQSDRASFGVVQPDEATPEAGSIFEFQAAEMTAPPPEAASGAPGVEMILEAAAEPSPEADADGEMPAEAGEDAEPERNRIVTPLVEQSTASVHVRASEPDFVERRVLEKPQAEDAEAGERAHALLDIMAIPTSGSLPQERALANDTLLRLIPRMSLKSLRHLANRVCLMEAPSEMLVRRLINDPRIEVSGPLLENAMTVNDSDLIAVASANHPAKLKLMARRRVISPALSEALIQSNHVDTLLNLIRNQGATFSIESMWRLTRFAAAHPALQAPLVTRQDTPSPIAFQLFWRLPSELRRYVLSRFLTDSETITKILSMNMGSESTEQKYADLSLLSRLEEAAPEEAGEIYAKLTQVSEETGARIADDAGGEALTVALKAAGLTRAQFAGIVDKRTDAEALKAIFETLSFNKARVLLTYWDWAAQRTGPYARTAAA